MGIDAEMFVRTRQPVTPEFVEDVRYRMCEAFGANQFWQWQGDEPVRALEIVSEIDQDGPTIQPTQGETFVRCHPRTRYYGPGYERGDLGFLIMLARYLEQAIPGGEVWYGGDSSGVVAERFGPQEQQVLWEHFLASGHTPYGEYFGTRLNRQPVPKCSFCAGKPMRYYGGDQTVSYFYCPGCDANLVVRGSDVRVRENAQQPENGAIEIGFDLQSLTEEKRNTLLGLLEACVKNPQDKAVHLVLNDWVRDRGIALHEPEDLRAIQVRPSEGG